MKRSCLVLVLCLPGAACALKWNRPASAPARAPVSVTSSFGKTWDAVIDYFASVNVPINAMERVSGFIRAERAFIPLNTKAERLATLEFATCGTVESFVVFPDTLYPSSAVYNVVVRGDSAMSTVLATAAYRSEGHRGTFECQSTGLFEHQIEDAVRSNAEGRESRPGR